MAASMTMQLHQKADSARVAAGIDRRNDASGELLGLQQRQSRTHDSRPSTQAKTQVSSRSRYLTLLATSVLTVAALWFDNAFVNGASGYPGMSNFMDWAIADSTLLFYLMGFATAYMFFRPRVQKKGRGGKSRVDDAAVATTKPGRKLSQSLLSGGLEASSEEASPARDNVVGRLAQALNEAATQGKAQRCEELISLLEGACKPQLPDATHYNQVLRAQGRRGDVTQVEWWLQRMREQGPQPNEQTYILVMSVHGKNGDLDALEHYMAQMLEDGPQPGTLSYSLMIHACGRVGDVRRGSAWLQRMTAAGVSPGIAIYNSLIHASGVSEDPVGAEQWYEEALKYGAQPTVTTYTTLIDVSAKALDLDRAERWMNEMTDRDIDPNVISFSSMMNACAKVGDLARAESWYEKMQKHGVQPNAYSYSAVIDACAKVGDVDAAYSWLSRAEETGAAVDAVVYGCVLNACGRAGDAEKAAEVFSRMKARGVRTGVVIYSALARPFAYRGDYEEVERLASEMNAEGIEVNDYFLYALLLSYSRARPRQGERAAKAFCEAAARGMPLARNERVMKALGASVGRARACELADLCGLTGTAA